MDNWACATRTSSRKKHAFTFALLLSRTSWLDCTYESYEYDSRDRDLSLDRRAELAGAVLHELVPHELPSILEDSSEFRHKTISADQVSFGHDTVPLLRFSAAA
ncbi:hypothetical protein AK812_SmicGene25963 [Symbiodinium microadriaticum]|uniref:Uncharacterized protein n=1 Tax=Symbiodinium microadriaticum TaxID=2951 RepID=A0A1Q9DAN6_SYMMI|nr:hypothetical protein AK812_SmicGene25963 [Symbiodinium microadriaticum]